MIDMVYFQNNIRGVNAVLVSHFFFMPCVLCVIRVKDSRVNTLKEKYESNLNDESMALEEVQRLLLEQDIPIEIAKELALGVLWPDL